MTRTRYKVLDDQYPHFITATIKNWLPVFTRPETVNILLDSWRFLRQDSSFRLFGYVILENHLHMVASSKNLARGIQRFKSFTAKEILICLQKQGSTDLLRLLEHLKHPYKNGSVHQVWEEGNHPQIITSEEIMRQKLNYIHQNPVKRGYVDFAEHWRYSSAWDYAGREGLIEVKIDW